MATPVCFICKKPCHVSDANTDGTHAHRDCLRQNMQRPLPKESS